MDIGRFYYELLYILFPIDLKLTECTHGDVVTFTPNLKLFGQSEILCENWSF